MTSSFYYVACLAGLISLHLEIMLLIGFYFLCKLVIPEPFFVYVTDTIFLIAMVFIIVTQGLSHYRLYKHQYQGRKLLFKRLLPTPDDMLAVPWMFYQQKYSFTLVISYILSFYNKYIKKQV